MRNIKKFHIIIFIPCALTFAQAAIGADRYDKDSEMNWRCHWFPKFQMGKEPGKINNLYAQGGALDKYDRVFGVKACDFEKLHHRALYSPGDPYIYWRGHQRQAALVSCFLKKPLFSVLIKEVRFTTHDVEGLLCEIIDSLIIDSTFHGSIDSKNWIQCVGSHLRITNWLDNRDQRSWRPHAIGNLSEKQTWVSKPENQHNPLVRAEDVYEIYMQSINR